MFSLPNLDITFWQNGWQASAQTSFLEAWRICHPHVSIAGQYCCFTTFFKYCTSARFGPWRNAHRKIWTTFYLNPTAARARMSLRTLTCPPLSLQEKRKSWRAFPLSFASANYSKTLSPLSLLRRGFFGMKFIYEAQSIAAARCCIFNRIHLTLRIG